jgi:hypothetical protein
MKPETPPGRIRAAFRRFFHQQEPGFTLRFAAYLVVVGLVYLFSWVAFFGVFYLVWRLWVELVELSYSSPKNYLIYSVLPLFALSLIFGVGRLLWEVWDEYVPGWWRRRRARRKRREDGRPG